MKRSFIAIGVVLAAIGAVAGGLFGALQNSASAGTAITADRIVADYHEALDVIADNYGGKPNRETISDTSIQGMLWTLDPHSSFFTREEFERLSQEQASQFYGIGVSILQHR
jgi:carboxyl-terminal processing protease